MEHDFWSALRETAGPVGAGLAGASAGRLIFLGYRLQSGDRRALAAWLLFELVVALFMGLCAWGMGTYWHLPPPMIFALAGLMGWLGPKGAQELFLRWLDRGPKKD